MAHPLIDQLRFTRSEWLRGLADISDEDGARRFGPMNCISWMVGHLAWHEQAYWLQRAQSKSLCPELNEFYAYGAPMSTPSLSEMLDTWRQITQATEPYLDSLTTEALQKGLLRDGKPSGQTIGSAMLRINYHYWYHTGEIQAIRQMLGHTNLAEYVGRIEKQAPYRPE